MTDNVVEFPPGADDESQPRTIDESELLESIARLDGVIAELNRMSDDLCETFGLDREAIDALYSTDEEDER